MGLESSILQRDLDKILAIAGVILSLILIIYMGRDTDRVVYLLPGALTLVSCLLWLVIRKKHPLEFHLPDSGTLTYFWATAFFALYTLSVLSIYLRPNLYARPLQYFILTALMGGIIACQIFTSSRRHVGLILTQVLLMGMSIAWSQTLIFPSLLGVDPYYHFAFTNKILDTGTIPDGSAYSNLPFFHMMIAIASLVADLPYKFAALVSVSFVQLLSNALFVFLIANRLFMNHRVGILAALMVIIANYHIFMSYWSIPNAFAGIFIPIAFYMLFFGLRKSSRFSSILLIVLILSPIILTHTLTAMCMAIILSVAWGSLVIYNNILVDRPKAEDYLSISIPFGFSIAMFGWWSYSSRSISTFSDLIRTGFKADFSVTTLDDFLRFASVIPLGEQLFNFAGMFLFFAISFIGIFYMISRKGNESTFAMAWVGLTPLAIGFFSLVTGHSVIEERWYYFAQILLSIPLAVTIYSIGTWKIERPKSVYCFAFGFVVILSFLMIMSPPANIDNHSFSPLTGSTYAYTESEMVASEYFAANANDLLSSDAYYCTSSSSSVFINIYAISPERLRSLDNSLISGEFDHDGSVKIIRSIWLREPLIRGASYMVRPDLHETLSESGFNRIYDNPSVSGYAG